jgi:hypothetical protein
MKGEGFSSIRPSLLASLFLLFRLMSPVSMHAQTTAGERSFPQSKATVEKALKDLQPFTSGRLPTLDGFAVPGDRPLEVFQRGFYQCTIQVSSNPSGGTIVRVSAKITAWYAASVPAQSGYQVLPSNGRLESDLLDRLADSLGHAPASSSDSASGRPGPAHASPSHTAVSSPPSAPVPDAPSSSMSAKAFRAEPPPADTQAASVATQRAVADRHLDTLRTESTNLEEILRNQSHPTNLVAVKAAGTPILAVPNEGGKVLFLATAEDEFEMLDFNDNWVHIRISGLSRGWIRRAAVEMNGEPAATVAQAGPSPSPSPAQTANQPRFTVEREETASFPGTWGPLKGKTVKIVTLQPAMPTGGDAQAKLDFTKSLFIKEYAELTQEKTTAVGIVVVFDSADGGMLAATLPVLRLWKEGTLSDEAMWRRCYVDPPEMVSDAAHP